MRAGESSSGLNGGDSQEALDLIANLEFVGRSPGPVAGPIEFVQRRDPQGGFFVVGTDLKFQYVAIELIDGRQHDAAWAGTDFGAGEYGGDSTLEVFRQSHIQEV